MLTIAAALCWYDEQPHALARCVQSLAGKVDTLVSMDGAYLDYPHDDPRSPLDQHDALISAADRVRLEHVVLDCDGPLTQTDKRTRLYRAAAAIADWVIIIDADEVLYVTDPYDMTRRLMQPGHDCASVLVRTGDAAAPHPRVLRALDGLTCGPEYHGMMSALDDDGRRVCIRDRRGIIMGEHPRPRRAREMDLTDIVTIENHTDDRPALRIDAKREYIKRRMAAARDL